MKPDSPQRSASTSGFGRVCVPHLELPYRHPDFAFTSEDTARIQKQCLTEILTRLRRRKLDFNQSQQLPQQSSSCFYILCLETGGRLRMTSLSRPDPAPQSPSLFLCGPLGQRLGRGRSHLLTPVFFLLIPFCWERLREQEVGIIK